MSGVKPKDLASVGVRRVGRVAGIRDGLPVLEGDQWSAGERGLVHRLSPRALLDRPAGARAAGEPVRSRASRPASRVSPGLHFLYALSSTVIRGSSGTPACIAETIDDIRVVILSYRIFSASLPSNCPAHRACASAFSASGPRHRDRYPGQPSSTHAPAPRTSRVGHRRSGAPGPPPRLRLGSSPFGYEIRPPLRTSSRSRSSASPPAVAHRVEPVGRDLAQPLGRVGLPRVDRRLGAELLDERRRVGPDAVASTRALEPRHPDRERPHRPRSAEDQHRRAVAQAQLVDSCSAVRPVTAPAPAWSRSRSGGTFPTFSAFTATYSA